jgi:hypothetical protein
MRIVKEQQQITCLVNGEGLSGAVPQIRRQITSRILEGKRYLSGNRVRNVVSFLSDITAQSLMMLTSLMDTVGCDTVELF